MEIYLENIGKVKQARIKINGITAGENDTGKSTIGKAFVTKRQVVFWQYNNFR